MEPQIEKILMIIEAIYMKVAQNRLVDDASFRDLENIYLRTMALRYQKSEKDASDVDDNRNTILEGEENGENE